MFRSDGTAKSFDAYKRCGIRVEITTLDINTAKRELENEAMHVYTYLDGEVLYDPEGLLENLAGIAQKRFVSFRSSPEDRKAIAYWLESVAERLEGSISSGDELRAAYLTSTVSWKMLEGLWAASDRPMPPSGSVWAHLPELVDDPSPLEHWLKRAFIGDTQERASATLTIIRRTVARLRLMGKCLCHSFVKCWHSRIEGCVSIGIPLHSGNGTNSNFIVQLNLRKSYPL